MAGFEWLLSAYLLGRRGSLRGIEKGGMLVCVRISSKFLGLHDSREVGAFKYHRFRSSVELPQLVVKLEIPQSDLSLSPRAAVNTPHCTGCTRGTSFGHWLCPRLFTVNISHYLRTLASSLFIFYVILSDIVSGCSLISTCHCHLLNWVLTVSIRHV
jgi:hypothetical protein